MSAKDELRKLIDLVKMEKEEDLLQFREMVLQTPLEERKEQGISWYPINILDEEVGLGGRLILEIQRMENRDQPHLFSNGSIVSIFGNAGGRSRPPFITGVVTKVYDNRMFICLNHNELPSWIEKYSLGLDLAHDEKTFMEMDKALVNVIHAENNRTAELREILLGYQQASIKTKIVSDLEIPSFLNISQQQSLKKVLETVDVGIIHGPPGTGKTTTVVAAIEMVLRKETQVLVCAPSNASVDLLVSKLMEKGQDILRLGHPARTNTTLHEYTLDVKMTKHHLYKKWRKFRKKAIEMRDEALRFKRHFDSQRRQERYDMLRESRLIFEETDKLEKAILDDIFANTRVIVCTLVGAANENLRRKRFATIFIDEAAQGLEPACWIPILLGDRVIFAGDHCQLPPTIKSKKAELAGLANTLMEKCIEKHQNTSIMLQTQYRMNQQIMEFSNRWFYNGQLIADGSVANETLIGDAVEFIDTAGYGAEEILHEKTMSLSNPGEVELLKKHWEKLSQNLKTIKDFVEVGIIAPYKEQVYLLRKELKGAELYENIKISINTVDSFQGQERDIIYISMVRSNERLEIGFLNDIRRMNVAMTRAKKKLVVIGDSATLSAHKFYRQFFEYIDEIGAYKSAWEFAD